MSDQEKLQQINSILDKVYSLDLTPVNGINEISKVMANYVIKEN